MIGVLLFVALSQQQYVREDQFPALYEVLKDLRCFDTGNTCVASSKVMFELFATNDSKAIACTTSSFVFGCSEDGSLVSLFFRDNIPVGATISTSIGRLTTLTNLALTSTRTLVGTVPRSTVLFTTQSLTSSSFCRSHHPPPPPPPRLLSRLSHTVN
jgi:hypothetical protein